MDHLLKRITTIADTDSQLLALFTGGSQSGEIDEDNDERVKAKPFKPYFVYSLNPVPQAEAENHSSTRIESYTVQFQCWDLTDISVMEGLKLLQRKFLPLGSLDKGAVRKSEIQDKSWFKESADLRTGKSFDKWQGALTIEYKVQVDLTDP